MRFFITGGTGFAGPHLIKLLISEGHEVSALIRGSNGRQMDLVDVLTVDEIDTVDWCFGDLCNVYDMERVFQEQSFDGVFHLAAQSHPPTSFLYPESTFMSNVMGTMNLLEAMEDSGTNPRFHFCSTSEVYGDLGKDVGKLHEELPMQPNNPYGTSKAAIDLHVQERIRNGSKDWFITRAFSHTGPRRGKNFSISSDAYQLAQMIVGGPPYELKIGNLKPVRAVMDVRDVVQIYYRLMLSRQTGIFNVGSRNGRPMQHYTDKLVFLSGLGGVKQVIHKPFYRDVDIQCQIPSLERVLEAIGTLPGRPIEETLSDLLDYWIHKLSPKPNGVHH